MILRALEGTKPVYLASLASLALGLFFVFVWSPLPWGWLGIDFYHDRAIRLAAGEPFDTTDVPWGYAYYVALFYMLFGPHPWLPLVGQVVLNALSPILLYRFARPLTDQRTAVLAAVLTGLFSFNTVYTSTLSSDAVCTVIFLASLLLFERGYRTGALTAFAMSGLLAGLAPQFRPNLILFPPLLAALYLFSWRPAARSARRKVAEITIYLALAAFALAPWVLRNYVLTRSFLPTSTHGGIQLWYGTLQTGEYIESRAYNPRSAFETPPFDYTSLENLPIVVTAAPPACPTPERPDLTLILWTDRDPTRTVISARARDGDTFRFELPGQPAPTTVYYYFEPGWMPGAEEPFVFFVSTDHLGDLDRHHDLLDIFDVIRMLRSLAWDEGTDRVTEMEVRQIITILLAMVERGTDPVAGIEITEQAVTVRFRDGSTLSVPRTSTGRVTDLAVNGDLAGKLFYARGPRSMATSASIANVDPCRKVESIAVNEVYYRKEPHLMRRYSALAMDNIARDPAAFAVASLYRAVRLFIVKGSTDPRTAQQFSGSRFIYTVAFVLSVLCFGIFVTGVWLARRRRYRVLPLLLPIVYVPLTICFVLTNMRYTVTVQPFMFVFAAAALVAILEKRLARSGV